LYRKNMRTIRWRVTHAALAGLGLLLCTCGAAAPAGAWSEFGLAEDLPDGPTGGLAIQEPLFDFLLGLVEADSLGHWSGAHVRAHARRLARPSRFPLADLVSISRSRPDSLQAVRYAGARVHAVWHLVLTAAQDRPMPYSILGYHPGSLRIAQEIVLSELAAADLKLSYRTGEVAVQQLVTGTRIFAVEQGYVLMDADGWLDALLGVGLDDAWILGFVTGYHDGQRLGLGVSIGRKGRWIFGEFDFATDEVLVHGRPLAKALSRTSRLWLNGNTGNLPEPWREH